MCILTLGIFCFFLLSFNSFAIATIWKIPLNLKRNGGNEKLFFSFFLIRFYYFKWFFRNIVCESKCIRMRLLYHSKRISSAIWNFIRQLIAVGYIVIYSLMHHNLKPCAKQNAFYTKQFSFISSVQNELGFCLKWKLNGRGKQEARRKECHEPYSYSIPY